MHTQRQDITIISVVVGQGGNQVAVTTGSVSSTVRNIWQASTSSHLLKTHGIQLNTLQVPVSTCHIGLVARKLVFGSN